MPWVRRNATLPFQLIASSMKVRILDGETSAMEVGDMSG
jgi:hypothetical protein